MLRQKLLKFKELKSCQILCAHKHCFLMPGQKYAKFIEISNLANHTFVCIKEHLHYEYMYNI